MATCNFLTTLLLGNELLNQTMLTTTYVPLASSSIDTSTVILPFTVAIKYDQNKLQTLEETFWSVSDPRNPMYGKYLTYNQIQNLLTPVSNNVDTVLSWLSQAAETLAITNLTLSPFHDYIHGYATVSALETLFSTRYTAYQLMYDHNQLPVPDTAIVYRIASATLYTIPASVQPLIDFIHPTNYMPAPPHAHHGRAHPSRRTTAPNDGVTPTVIRNQYNIGTVENTVTSNRQQAAGFLGQFAAQSDLTIFYNQFYPIANNRKINFVGPVNQSNSGVEADLDVQYISSIGGNVNTTFWYVDGCYNGCNNEPYTTWLEQVLAVPDSQLPYVISVSYGDNENTVPPDFANRSTVGFMALGSKGVSVLFSSGDGGVAGSQSSPCTTFIPNFPATSIAVTSVGGTTGSPETAASFSSGGFSNYYGRPSYQDTAVKNYFAVASNLPPIADYNGTGRGFPDVSALSESFNIVCGGGTIQVDGTSCAAPTFSGLVSLLNSLRFAVGKSSLGFLNPLFYQNPDVFTDVTQGNNPGCNTNGFYAAKGWDPVTGLGSPNYEKLKTLVLSLP